MRNNNNTDYYELLKVSRNASTSQIKKAYHKLSLKWHPDKNVNNKQDAELMFKQISEAYQVLSDENTRQIYDTYGKDGLTNNTTTNNNYNFNNNFSGFGFQFQSPQDVFTQFFGNRNPFEEFEQMFSNFNNSGFQYNNMHSNSMGFFNDFNTSFSDSFFSGPNTNNNFNINNNGGGYGTYTSTSTRIINGIKTTITETRDNQGNLTVVKEDHNGNVTKTVNGIAHNTIQNSNKGKSRKHIKSRN